MPHVVFIGGPGDDLSAFRKYRCVAGAPIAEIKRLLAGASLAWLLVRPWHLTNEFVRGRRVRYLHPIRLYLLASFAFFFATRRTKR